MKVFQHQEGKFICMQAEYASSDARHNLFDTLELGGRTVLSF